MDGQGQQVGMVHFLFGRALRKAAVRHSWAKARRPRPQAMQAASKTPKRAYKTESGALPRRQGPGWKAGAFCVWAMRRAWAFAQGGSVSDVYKRQELERPCPRAKEKVFRGRTAKPGGRPEAQRPTRRRALPFQRMRRRESGRLRGARRVRQCVFGRRVRAACGTAGPNRRTPYFARHAAARWHRGAFCTSAAARAHALAARMMWTSTRPFCPRARCAGAFCSGTERPKRRFIRRTGVTLCWAAGAVWLHVGPGRCAENEKEAGVC